MDRLLSYQGPIVHVDHSGRHRQAAPTGVVLQRPVTRSKVQRGRYFVEVPGSKRVEFDYMLSASNDAGDPMMSPEDKLAAWTALFKFAKTRSAKIVHRTEQVPTSTREFNLVIDPTYDYQLRADEKAMSVWYLGDVLEKDWKMEDGPVFAVQ